MRHFFTYRNSILPGWQKNGDAVRHRRYLTNFMRQFGAFLQGWLAIFGGLCIPVKSFAKRDHHKDHHDGKGKCPDDHGIAQGPKRVSFGPGIASNDQNPDHRGQDQSPDDAVLDSGFLCATRHDVYSSPEYRSQRM